MPSDLDLAKQRVLQEYPGLQKLDFDVIRGQGPGYAEFYPADEKYNPNPGRNTIEIRNLQGESPERVIAADALHLLSRENDQFRQLKRQFIGTLTPEQMTFARKRFQYDVSTAGEKRQFADWFDQMWSDALIRGYLFPDKADEFRKSDTYTLENTKVLDQIRELLRNPQ